MSAGSVLEQYSRRGGPGASDSAAERDPIDDLGCFGWLRGMRERAVMLELRKKTGNILAVSYGWLERVEFDPSEGIRLYLGGRTIRLAGRNLNAEARPQVRLFEGIARHRVCWVQEAEHRAGLFGSQQMTVVKQIIW